MGSQRVKHNWEIVTHSHTHTLYSYSVCAPHHCFHKDLILETLMQGHTAKMVLVA